MRAEDDALTPLICAIIQSSPDLMAILRHVAALDLPDCWVAAGAIRNAIWDHGHGWPARPPAGDIDVVWFDAGRTDPTIDRAIESALMDADPAMAWSVKNQARMHRRNDDRPYTSASDAMRFWPETATAVGMRIKPSGALAVAAPWGLTDLFALILRPAGAFAARKRAIFDDRVAAKHWLHHWPKLRLVELAIQPLANRLGAD